MKKITKFILPICLLVGSMLTIQSCTQKDFDENYYDPEKSVNATVEGLFTGFLYNNAFENRNPIFPRYWNLNTFQVPMPARYAQVVGFINTTGRYDQATAYAAQRWDYYYLTYISGYRSMQKKMATLSAEEQAAYQPFLEIANILLYDQTAQMVDMWGDIPFFEAGKLILENGELIRAKYDSAEQIYDFLLSDLKRVSDYIKTVQFDPAKKNLFNSNDIFFKGDLAKWSLYANSLRLRLAMRISYQNETKAKSIVQEILGANTYPVITGVPQNLQVAAEGDVLRSILNKHESGIRGGLIGTAAPGDMINKYMAPAADPRLQVLFSQNKEDHFVGVDPSWVEKRQDDSLANNFYSRIDSATFARNDQFPGILITAAEISLFKAEALERWNIGTGTAKAAYEQGIRESITSYFNINAMNKNSDGTSYIPKTAPTEEEITQFLATPMISYTGSKDQRLEKIGIQQWINFGVIQAPHAWAEVRRTGYPKLTFLTDNTSPTNKVPPTRLLYPDAEKTQNTENYQAVKDKDRVNVKVFWQAK